MQVNLFKDRYFKFTLSIVALEGVCYLTRKQDLKSSQNLSDVNCECKIMAHYSFLKLLLKFVLYLAIVCGIEDNQANHARHVTQ